MSKKTNLDYLHDLMVKIDVQLDDIKETQVRHDMILREHIRRTEANEEAIEHLKEQTQESRKQSYMVQGIVAFVVFLGVVAGIWESLK